MPRAAVLTALSVIAASLPPTGLTAAAELAAHHAIYRLTLESARSGSVTGASGTMDYEVMDACDGWATRQRMQMTLSTNEGQDIVMVSDYVTWESKDGLSFRFRMKQTTEQAVTSQTEGDASLTRTGGTGEVRYAVPQDTVKALPAGTLFPMMHTEAILAAARAGQKFMAVPLFDGTVDSGAQDSSVAILNWNPPKEEKFAPLSSLYSTRVHIAFFDQGASHQTPDYDVGMRYWENGVADELQMDFGEFVMRGSMSEFSLLPNRC